LLRRRQEVTSSRDGRLAWDRPRSGSGQALGVSGERAGGIHCPCLPENAVLEEDDPSRSPGGPLPVPANRESLFPGFLPAGANGESHFPDLISRGEDRESGFPDCLRDGWPRRGAGVDAPDRGAHPLPGAANAPPPSCPTTRNTGRRQVQHAGLDERVGGVLEVVQPAAPPPQHSVRSRRCGSACCATLLDSAGSRSQPRGRSAGHRHRGPAAYGGFE